MSVSSDRCTHANLIPIRPSDPEENQDQRAVGVLLLKTAVSGNARNGVSLPVLDQDDPAVLGPPLPASKERLPIGNTNFQTLQTSKDQWSTLVSQGKFVYAAWKMTFFFKSSPKDMLIDFREREGRKK